MSLSQSFSNDIRAHSGIFLISFATLMFEISLSRLLSITLWSPYAFLIISCALLGYGAAGSWLTLFPKPFHPFNSTFLFSLLLLPLFITANRLEFDPTLLSLSLSESFILLLIFLLLAVPFFLTGLTVTSVIQQYPHRAFTLYCFDLIGAALGCFSFFLLASLTNEIGWLVVISTIGVFAALCFSETLLKAGLALLVGCILAGGAFLQVYPDLQLGSYKALRQALQYPDARILESQWDGSVRIDRFESPILRSAPGLSLEYAGTIPQQIGISVDGGFLTAAGNPAQVAAYFDYLPGRLLYHLNPKEGQTLILEALGGQDIDLALQAGGRPIIAQTRYNLAAEWLSNTYRAYPVRLVTEKPRSFLASEEALYDRIVVSLEGALPTGMSGMNSLEKNYLRTVEGIDQLLAHLNSSGWAMFHLYLLPPSRAEVRLLATIIEVLKQRGLNPERHLGVFTTISTLVILVSADGWAQTDIDRFNAFCHDRGYNPVFYPGAAAAVKGANRQWHHSLTPETLQRLFSAPQTFYASSVIDYQPVKDDRPFFYNVLKLDRLAETYRLYDKKWEGLLEGGLLLPLLLVVVVALSVIFIVIPRLNALRTSTTKPSGLYYFLLLGFGFMMVEIAFIEKLTQFLGDPTYSFSLVLGGILLSGGIGSGVASTKATRDSRLVFLFLVLVLLGYHVGLETFLLRYCGSGFTIKLVLAVIVIFFPGLVMGTLFPIGIFAIDSHFACAGRGSSNVNIKRAAIAIAWCYNSFASVVGSVLAMTLAVYSGISTLFLWAAALYGLAYFAIRKLVAN